MEYLAQTMLCFVVLLVCQGTHGWSRMTSRLVELPEPEMIDKITYVEQDIDYKETTDKVTALKSKRLHACFVLERDPYWNPSDDDLIELMTMETTEQFEESVKFEKLTRLAGDVIAHMCKTYDVYWFVMSGPPLLQPLAPVPGSKDNLPPRLAAVTDNPLPPPKMLVQATQEPQGPQTVGSEGPQSENGNGDLVAPPVMTNRNVDLISPPLTSNGNGELFAPPPMNSGNGDLIAPPPMNGDLLPPPLASNGNGDLLPPPLASNGNGDLSPPPLKNSAIGDLLLPPIANNGNGDLLPPPLINNEKADLLPPPLISNEKADLLTPPLLDNRNSDLLPPPLINQGNGDLNPPPIANTPPSLAQLLGMNKVEGPGPRPQATYRAPPPPMPRAAHNYNAPTLAPPIPDFRTPELYY